MKSLTAIFILFLMISIISCSKKNETTPTPMSQQDYRAQYLGDYYCTGRYSYWNDTPPIHYQSDTSMTIHVYRDVNNDSNILICGSTLTLDSTAVKLSSNKTFTGGDIAPYHIGIDGNFFYDSIWFYQRNTMGIGMHRGFNMKGKKK